MKAKLFSSNVRSFPTPGHSTALHILSLGCLLLALPATEALAAGVTEVYAFDNYFNPSTLLLAADGKFYGTLSGAVNTGVVFRVTAGGTYAVLAGLSPSVAALFRGGPLLQEADGALYGTGYSGGAGGGGVYPPPCGSIFRVSPSGEVSLLYSFSGTNGAYPLAGLTRGVDGSLYGTTSYGGTNMQPWSSVLTSPGTVFRISTNGAFSTLVHFNRTNNGAVPEAPLLCGADSALYGTTVAGGPSDQGTVFRLSTNGTLTTLFAFGGTNGAHPYSGLVQTPDGTLYGTTAEGGATNLGTVFSISPNGIFTTLASFNGTNGANPYSGLVLGSDGALYGTTDFGGPGFDGSQNSGYGTVFRVGNNGDILTVGTFDGTNGSKPVTGLVQGPDGYLYGTCSSGGSHGAGNVYRVANRARVHLSLTSTGDKVLSWNAIPGLSYQPQFSTDLVSAQWQSLGVSLVAMNAEMTMTNLAEASSQLFYRVVESP